MHMLQMISTRFHGNRVSDISSRNFQPSGAYICIKRFATKNRRPRTVQSEQSSVSGTFPLASVPNSSSSAGGTAALLAPTSSRIP